jgi:hypothetical protein
MLDTRFPLVQNLDQDSAQGMDQNYCTDARLQPAVWDVFFLLPDLPARFVQ